MNEFPISSWAVERLGWVLVHSLWQFAAIAFLTGASLRWLRHGSATIRYGVVCVALVAIVISPAATWILQPDARPTDSAGQGVLSLVHRTYASASFAAENGPIDAAWILSAAANDGGTALGYADSADSTGAKLDATADRFPDASIDASAEALATKTPNRTAEPGSGSSWLARTSLFLRPWLVAGWCVGVLFCSLRPLLGWRALRRLRRVGVSPVSNDVRTLLRRVSSRLGLRRAVDVMHSSLAQVPVVVGYARPIILLPVSLVTSIPAAQLEAILAHELAHVRRNDFLVNLLQTLVETVFFFHPAVWWLSDRLRAERENCCDDLVIDTLGNRLEYGRALLAIEEIRGRAVLAVGASDGSLLARVRRISGLESDTANGSPWSALSLIVCGFVAVVVMFIIGWNSLAETADETATLQPGRYFAELPGASKADVEKEEKHADTVGATTPAGDVDRETILLGEPSFRLPGHSNIQCVAYDTDGKELVVVSTNRVSTVRRWDMVGKKLMSEVILASDKHLRPFRGGTFQLSGDRRRVVAATDDFVGIWDTTTGELLKKLPFPKKEWEYDCVRCLACSSDLSVIVAGLGTTYDRTTIVYNGYGIVWDGVSGEVVQNVTHQHGHYFGSVVLTSDGKRFATRNEHGGGVCIWETGTGKLLHEIRNDPRWESSDPKVIKHQLVRSIQFSPDDKWLAVGSTLGVELYDAQSGKRLRRIEAPYRYHNGSPGLVFSVDGRRLAQWGTWANDKRRTTTIWSTQTGETLFELSAEAHAGAFSDDGNQFAVGMSDREMALAVFQLRGRAAEGVQPPPESSKDKTRAGSHFRRKKAEADKKIRSGLVPGQFGGFSQPMRFAPGGSIFYGGDRCLCQMTLSDDERLKVVVRNDREIWTDVTLSLVRGADGPHRAVWSAELDGLAYHATAIPVSTRGCLVRLEKRIAGKLIHGSLQFFAVKSRQADAKQGEPAAPINYAEWRVDQSGTGVVAGRYTGASQVMQIADDGSITYSDRPMGICHLAVLEDNRLTATFSDARGLPIDVTLPLVTTAAEHRATWSADVDGHTLRATAVPYSDTVYIFQLEKLRGVKLIEGSQQIYAIDQKLRRATADEKSKAAGGSRWQARLGTQIKLPDIIARLKEQEDTLKGCIVTAETRMKQRTGISFEGPELEREFKTEFRFDEQGRIYSKQQGGVPGRFGTNEVRQQIEVGVFNGRDVTILRGRDKYNWAYHGPDKHRIPREVDPRDYLYRYWSEPLSKLLSQKKYHIAGVERWRDQDVIVIESDPTEKKERKASYQGRLFVAPALDYAVVLRAARIRFDDVGPEWHEFSRQETFDHLQHKETGLWFPKRGTYTSLNPTREQAARKEAAPLAWKKETTFTHWKPNPKFTDASFALKIPAGIFVMKEPIPPPPEKSEWLMRLEGNGLLSTLDEDGQVNSLTISSIATNEILEKLAALPNLRELHIEVTKNLTPAGLKHLGNIETLETLSLYEVNREGNGLGDEALQAIAGLKSLRELRISNCGLTDTGARHLEGLKQLTRLELDEGRLTDAALGAIGKLSHLKHLGLSSYVGTAQYGRMSFTPAGLESLRGLTALDELHLVGQEVTASLLLSWPKLTALSVGGATVDDACAERIAACRELKSLSLVFTAVSDKGIQQIATLPALRRLNLDSRVVTNASIEHLKAVTMLQMLTLRTTRLTDESLRHIAEMKSLSRLDLHGSGEPGPVSGDRFSIAALRQLKELPKLRTLYLTNFRSSGSYLELKELKQLRVLSLMMSDIRTDELDTLQEALPDTTIHSASGGGFRRPKRAGASMP